MAHPTAYLPDCPDEAINKLFSTLGYPQPSAIHALNVSAEFHRIWLVSFTDSSAGSYKSIPNEVVLRVAGTHLPEIKTENEIAFIEWLRRNTDVPTPQIIAWDKTVQNELQYEYMVMEKVPGVVALDLYDNLSAEQMSHILTQLAKINLELWNRPQSHVGGFRFDQASSICPGPVLDEDLWFIPDVVKFVFPRDTSQPLELTKCAQILARLGGTVNSQPGQQRWLRHLRALAVCLRKQTCWRH